MRWYTRATSIQFYLSRSIIPNDSNGNGNSNTMQRAPATTHHQKCQGSLQLAPQWTHWQFTITFFAARSDCSSSAISCVWQQAKKSTETCVWNAHTKILDKNCICNCEWVCARISSGESSMVNTFFSWWNSVLFSILFGCFLFALCWYYKTILYIPFYLATCTKGGCVWYHSIRFKANVTCDTEEYTWCVT